MALGQGQLPFIIIIIIVIIIIVIVIVFKAPLPLPIIVFMKLWSMLKCYWHNCCFRHNQLTEIVKLNSPPSFMINSCQGHPLIVRGRAHTP